MDDDYSFQERAAIVRKFTDSGLSVADFCRWACLPRWRLRRWLEAVRAPEDATWIEVEIGKGDEQAAREGGARC